MEEVHQKPGFIPEVLQEVNLAIERWVRSRDIQVERYESCASSGKWRRVKTVRTGFGPWTGSEGHKH